MRVAEKNSWSLAFRGVKRFALAGAILILLWALAIPLFSLPNYILPSPWDVIQQILSRGSFYLEHTLSTILSASAGFAVGLAAALCMAIAATLLPRVKFLIESVAVVGRTLPIVALAPLIVFWLGATRISQVVVVAIVCFFPIFSGLIRGMERADPSAIMLFRLYGGTRRQVFWHLQVPSAIPSLVGSIPPAVTLAVLGALVAEFTGFDMGLGSLVLRGLYRLDTKMLFSANMLAASVGILSYLLSLLLQIPFGRYTVSREIGASFHSPGATRREEAYGSQEAV